MHGQERSQEQVDQNGVLQSVWSVIGLDESELSASCTLRAIFASSSE